MQKKTVSKVSSVGENISAENASWTFGDSVPTEFTEHVKRSVPYYESGHDVVCKISDFFLKDGSTCYELGVSTGALIKKMSNHHRHRDVRFIGIDIEEKMIEQAQKEIGDDDKIQIIADDINSFDYEPADLIVSYYTIQFVPPRLRQYLIDTIFKSLNWGGAFLMFEKVRACDARFQDMMTLLYSDYKLEQGYSSEEIIAKSRSLKGVLEPFSTQGNIDLLKRAGFVDYMSVMKYLCFEGFLAIK